MATDRPTDDRLRVLRDNFERAWKASGFDQDRDSVIALDELIGLRALAAAPRPTEAEFVAALTELLDGCATAHSDQSSSEAIKAALAEQTSKCAKVLDLFRRARGDEGAMAGLIEAAKRVSREFDARLGTVSGDAVFALDNAICDALDAAKRAGGA